MSLHTGRRLPRRGWAALSAIFAVALVAFGAGSPATASSSSVPMTWHADAELTHTPVGAAAIAWNATTHTLTVTIVEVGFAPHSIHPAHIHLGRCSSSGPIAYMLQDVVANQWGVGASVTTIAGVMHGIPSSGWYVNVHNGPTLATPDQATPISCGVVMNVRHTSHSNETATFHMGDTNAASQHVHGYANLSIIHGNQLAVHLSVSGLQPYSVHAEHIHLGSCLMPDGIAYKLPNLVANAHGYASMSTVINGVHGIPTSGWFINIHFSTNLSTQTGYDPVACGDIMP